MPAQKGRPMSVRFRLLPWALCLVALAPCFVPQAGHAEERRHQAQGQARAVLLPLLILAFAGRVGYPLIVKPWIAAVARRLGGSQDRKQTKKLQLDAMGTSVWDLVDGKRSVRTIIQIFAKAHRLENREAEVSVTSFIRQLGQRGLLGLG
mgnify:CR=1 FL=1